MSRLWIFVPSAVTVPGTGHVPSARDAPQVFSAGVTVPSRCRYG